MRFLTVPLLATLPLLWAPVAQPSPYFLTIAGKPDKITDGDTIRINDQKIRLWGVDTPESDQKCENSAGKCFKCGKSARDFLKQLIDESGAQNGAVYCTATGEMTYGRHVGICYAGDTNLNEQMVLHGWGVAYARYTPALVPAEKRARALKRGLWAGEFVNPEDWRRGDRLHCEE